MIIQIIAKGTRRHHTIKILRKWLVERGHDPAGAELLMGRLVEVLGTSTIVQEVKTGLANMKGDVVLHQDDINNFIHGVEVEARVGDDELEDDDDEVEELEDDEVEPDDAEPDYEETSGGWECLHCGHTVQTEQGIKKHVETKHR